MKTVLIREAKPLSAGGEPDDGKVSFRPAEFPMIEKISSLDLHREELEAIRTFSLEKDLWITDHRPFKFLKHPIVSAAMVLETFLEASRLLYPYLQACGVRNLQLTDMIQCRPGVSRPSLISCRRSGNGRNREVLCDVTLGFREISPTGRLTERFTPQCKGEVILDGGKGVLVEKFPDFPVRPEELRTRPMNHKQVLKWYKKRSGLTGRYRVIESIDGAAPGVIRGRTVYPETRDFAHLQNTRYQYAPYLFEALLQLVGFHVAATNPSEGRSMIPSAIQEMRFLRKCRVGEKITLEARLRGNDKESLTWDAAGVDDQGRTLMQICGLRMQWISE